MQRRLPTQGLQLQTFTSLQKLHAGLLVSAIFCLEEKQQRGS